MRILQLLTIVAALGTFVPFGHAQDSSSFRSLYRFTGHPDGGHPQAGVVIGKNGVLYGTTNLGGIWAKGAVFSLTPPSTPGGAWTETVLYSFTGASDGANPEAGVVIGSGGVLYGTASGGGGGTASCPYYSPGCGTVFSLTPPASLGAAWTETVLWSFTGGTDGAVPYAPVVIGGGGVLYGTTYYGGSGNGTSGNGTVFSLTPPTSPGGAWTETVLITFPPFGQLDFSGANPDAPAVIGSGGVLYGTTAHGGMGPCTILGTPVGCGTVFSVAPVGYLLHDFMYSGDGEIPAAGVVIGSGGVLYGTTSSGGTSNLGTVFSVTPSGFNGPDTVLYSFAGGSDGANPEAGLVIGSGGVLYGTTELGGTSNYGTVFKLAPPTTPGEAWTKTVLHNFTGGGDGRFPRAGLVIGQNGVLLGTTYGTAGPGDYGTVFALKP